MASRPRRARIVLGVITLAVIGLGVWAWEPLYWWVVRKSVPRESLMPVMRWETSRPSGFRWVSERASNLRRHPYRGWDTVRRFGTDRTNHGPSVAWYLETGFKAFEQEWHDGEAIRTTYWNPDGSIAWQSTGDTIWIPLMSEDPDRTHPPWLWGVTAQTEPSMPEWMKDDAKWQAALDAQK